MSHKLGHCDLFSYISLIKVLYSCHNQFPIFMFFVVPKNSILLKINGFHMFIQNKVLFVFHIERNLALDIYLFLTT